MNYSYPELGYYFNTNLTLSAEFFLNVEAGTGFIGELVVAVDGGVGELFLQLFYECPERGFLSCRTGVLGLAVRRQTADIADAETDSIVTFAVCANLVHRSSWVYAAVKTNYKVITYAVEASLAMPAVDIFDSEVLALFSGTAMNDDFCYFSHDRLNLNKIKILIAPNAMMPKQARNLVEGGV